MYCDYTDRAKTAGLLAIASPIKAQIKEVLESGKEIIDPSTLNELIPSNYLSYYHIDKSGNIIIFSESIGTLIELKPTLKDKKVSWSCFGLPHKNVQLACRK